MAQALDYYPFGDNRLNLGTHRETKTFTGHTYDPEADLLYTGARYYRGQTGRFFSQDPAVLAVGDNGQLKQITGQELQQYLSDPQNLNSYTYARNHPLIYSDKNGEFAFLIPLAAYAVACAPVWVPAAITWIAASTLAISAPLVGGQIYSYNKGDQAMGDQFGNANQAALGLGTAGISGVMAVDSMISASMNSSSNRSQPVTVNVSDRNAQKGFTKHGSDFGMSGNWNPSRANEFRDTINGHVNSADVQAIEGTYRGTTNVTHYYNPQTNVDVMVDNSGNYVGGWKLSGSQASNLITNNNVQ